MASIQTKPDSTQKFGLFGRSTSGEKSPLASTPLVSGKTQTPDKPLDVVKSDSQSNEKPAGGLFANLNKPAQETKPAAFTFGSALFGNKPTTTPQPTATNETPNVDEQPKLTRQDSTQLLRLDSKNTTEEKQLEAAAKKETPESDASNKASETKNINLFNSNAFPTPGQKTISLFGNQTSGNQPFNLTPKPEEKPSETKPEEQTTPTKTEPSKNIFSGLIKSDEKKADAPSGGIFGNKSDNNGAKIGGLFGNNNNKPSGGIFGNLNKSDEKEKAEEKKPEPVAEKKEEPKPEVKPSGLFSQLTPGGPLFGKPQAETVAPLVSNSTEPKQKVSLFKDILPPKEEPKTAADTKPEAETKPVGGLFGKLFNNTGDLSQLAKKDYSATKFDTSGENTENELKEAEKERREKEREKALAEKAQEKPKFNPWANLNNPQPKPELGSSKSGLFGSSSSEGGLFANLNTPSSF